MNSGIAHLLTVLAAVSQLLAVDAGESCLSNDLRVLADQAVQGNSMIQSRSSPLESLATSRSEPSPSLVFHILTPGSKVPAWAEGANLELHFFAPNQSKGAFACETNDKPLNGSRVSAVPGWWAAQRQFMTSLKSLLSKHPAADYYMVVDDDTMVLRHNLQTLITSLERDVLDPNEHLYMGHAVLHPELQIPYVMSGGGVLLRGGTLRLLDQQGLLDSYALRATRDLCWHHFAWQLGGALAEIGVKALGHPGFQQSMQYCTTCCHSGSVACHPFKDRALQETLLATYAKQEGILKPMKLTKHLAEACGKNYSWHEQRSECGASSNYLNLFEDSSQTKDNLCIEGRIVPELLLLGAQKAATTTLAKELMSIPGIIGRVLAAEDRFFEWKEAHIYDSLAKWQNKDSWKQGYVTCTDETRIVSIDATPDYLHSTAAPQRILENYGDRAQHVKFIVLLREPLARTQSAFYHLREKAAAWGVKNSQIFKASFQQYIQQRLANNLTAMDQDPVNVSLYPRQLANYFDVFSSQQFSIAPFRSVLEDSSLANHIAKRLGLPQMLQLGKPPQVNAHQHPTFEGDLEPSVLSKVRAYFDETAGAWKVAEVLVGEPGSHAELVRFEGERTSTSSVSEWLASTW